MNVYNLIKDKRAIVVSTIAAFLGFELNDIQILESLGYTVYVATNFNTYEDMHDKLTDIGVRENHQLQVDFTRSPFTAEIPKAYFELEKILEKGQFNLMHCHTPVGGVLGRLAAKHYNDRHPDKRMTVIYTAHGFHFYDGAPKKNWMLYYPIEKQLSKYTDVLITINHEDYHRASEKFFAKKTVYIPGVGIDTNKIANTIVDKDQMRIGLGIPKEAFLIMSVGELSKRKNQILVLQALAKIKDENSADFDRIHYLMVGKGDQKKVYQDYIRTHNMSDNIHMIGYREDVYDLLKISDTFIFPSKQEGLPVALLEAMASGTGIICSNIRGNTDCIDADKGGLLFPPSSVTECKAAIQLAMSDKDFRRKCGQYNADKVQMFDQSVVMQKYRKVISEI